MLTSVELCAGAGGQALGLEKAGFGHNALVEIDKHCCATLRHNRPEWNVLEEDVRKFKEVAADYAGIDLLAGGLPCPPFSVAGKQLGPKDERNLFDDALEIVDATRPKAVMIENVRGFLDAVFLDYREKLKGQLSKLGYETDWRLLNASDFGVPQRRRRVLLVGWRGDEAPRLERTHAPADEAAMLGDIDAVRSAGLAGVVIGANLADGRLDVALLERLMRHADGLGVTLHRAFDLVPDPVEALDVAMTLGVERILTSGLVPRAIDGVNLLKQLVDQAGTRLSIMPGSGVTPANVVELLNCSSGTVARGKAGKVARTRRTAKHRPTRYSAAAPKPGSLPNASTNSNTIRIFCNRCGRTRNRSKSSTH